MPAILNPLRPLGLGELIDRAVNFWRLNWKPLFQLMLGFQLVEGILVAASQGLARVLFPLASDPNALQHAGQIEALHLMGKMGLLTLAAFASLFIAQIAGVAATHFSFARLTNKGQPNPTDSFRHAAARLGTTAGAFALSMVWSLLVMLLLLLPSAGLAAGALFLKLKDSNASAAVLGVLAALALIVGTVVLVVWFAIRFILVSQIIAVEPMGALATFRRADALSSGRVYEGLGGIVKLRLTALVTIVGTVLLIVSVVASMPMLFAGAAFGANFTAGNTIDDVVPLSVLIPLQLLQSVMGAVLAPLYIVFQTFFYTDMRVRREGLDLELALGT